MGTEGYLGVLNQDSFHFIDASFGPPPLDHVLLEVEAIGVNRGDLLQYEGKYPPPLNAPDYGNCITLQCPTSSPKQVPGLEVVGRVITTATRGRGPQPGERVMALVATGGYGSHTYAHMDLCLSVPEFLSSAEAACFPEALWTLWNTLYHRPWISEGDSLLIHGGSSGIGIIGIQLAKIYNQKVFVTVKNQEKADICRHFGASETILYPTMDFVEEISRLTSGRGVDVILDCVGGHYTLPNLKSLSPGGRLLQIAAQSQHTPRLSLGLIMEKQLIWTGATLRSQPLEKKIALAKDLQQKILPFIKDGTLRGKVDSLFPLTDCLSALNRLKTQNHIGKIVLYPDKK